MSVITTKIPGVLLLVPTMSRDMRGIRYDLDLPALSGGPGAFVSLGSAAFHAYPRAAYPALISDDAQLVRVLDGALFVGLANVRRGHPAMQDCIALANGGLPHAGAALLVPGGIAMGFVVGDVVTRFCVDRESGKPCVVAPDGLLKWPVPAEPPMPQAMLVRQRVQAEAPKVAPEAPEPPAPTRAGTIDAERRARLAHADN